MALLILDPFADHGRDLIPYTVIVAPLGVGHRCQDPSPDLVVVYPGRVQGEVGHYSRCEVDPDDRQCSRRGCRKFRRYRSISILEIVDAEEIDGANLVEDTPVGGGDPPLS